MTPPDFAESGGAAPFSVAARLGRYRKGPFPVKGLPSEIVRKFRRLPMMGVYSAFVSRSRQRLWRFVW